MSGAASEVYDMVGGHRIMVAQVAEFCGHTSTRFQPEAGCAPSAAKMKRSGCGDISLLREALATEDGAALCGSEGDSGFLAALGAGGSSFHARKMVRVAHAGWGGEDGYALGLTGLTAFGLVFELFVAEKQLFPGGEDKVNTAIDAGQYLILKFH